MAISLVVNGITYEYPQTSNEGWGTNATNWALAVTQNLLPKAGGLFALTGDIDFGPNFGLKSAYYKTRSANLAATGNFRLATADTISFRNSGNTGDLALGTGSSDIAPAYAGVDLVTVSGTQTLTNKTISTVNTGSYNFTFPSTAPSTNTFLEFDGANYVWTTASGLGTVTSVGMTVPSFLSVTPASITTTGTFAVTLATQAANTVLIGPATGGPLAPTFRALVATDIPTLNQNTTGTSANVTGTVAIANGGTGQTTASPAFNALSPMTTLGDTIYGGASGSGTRLAIGTLGQFLTVSAGGIPTWTTIGATTSTVVTVTTSATMASGTDIELVNQSAAATITLPAVFNGKTITIKDISGTASVNHITLLRAGSALIDGQTQLIINSDYASVSLISDGTNWFGI